MATYIIHGWHMGDWNAAVILAQKTGFELLLIPEGKDPSVYDPQYDDNNLICMGLWYANPYTAYYFSELTTVDGILTGPYPGIYRGRFIISTVTRTNGTTVTVVGGVHAPDTLTAARYYPG